MGLQHAKNATPGRGADRGSIQESQSQAHEPMSGSVKTGHSWENGSKRYRGYNRKKE